MMTNASREGRDRACKVVADSNDLPAGRLIGWLD